MDKAVHVKGSVAHLSVFRNKNPEASMAVKRIVANFAVDGVDRARAFYVEVLGLEVAMDLGWILTFQSDFKSAPQVSVATEGGSGTSVPELSVEVDNLNEVYHKALAEGFEVEYRPGARP